MLTPLFLAFIDTNMSVAYNNSRRVFHARLLPVITLSVLFLCLISEYLVKFKRVAQITSLTLLVNWVILAWFLLLTLLLRYCNQTTWFVCPSLTLLVFYYFAVIDNNPETVSTFFLNTVGITVSFFIMICLTEVWLISFAVYCPVLTYYLWAQGRDMIGNESTELVMRTLFCSVIYAMCAYRVENLNKYKFIGKDTSERTFYRWLKIFETFPEGLALIRNNFILYANKSLPTILDFNDWEQENDPHYTNLRERLARTDVNRLSKEKDGHYETTIWNFLKGKEKGAPFAVQTGRNLNVDGDE